VCVCVCVIAPSGFLLWSDCHMARISLVVIEVYLLCYCVSLSLASVKSRIVFLFWYRLTRVIPHKVLGAVKWSCVCVDYVCALLVNLCFSLSATTLGWVTDNGTWLVKLSVLVVPNGSVPSEGRVPVGGTDQPKFTWKMGH